MSGWDPGALPRGEGHILCTVKAPSAEILISSPRRRNAISPGMMVDLTEVLNALRLRTDISVVLLRGEGDAFCAGGDLRAVREHLLEPDAGAGMCTHMTRLLDELADLPVVVVGAVTGPALGGGAEILTICDVIHASASARIGFVHAALGVSPGWGGGRRLVRRVGRHGAIRLLTEAERLTAEQACAAGLVDGVSEDGLAAARAHCERLAAMPVEAVRAAAAIAKGAPEGPIFSSLWGGRSHRTILAGVEAGR